MCAEIGEEQQHHIATGGGGEQDRERGLTERSVGGPQQHIVEEEKLCGCPPLIFKKKKVSFVSCDQKENGVGSRNKRKWSTESGAGGDKSICSFPFS